MNRAKKSYRNRLLPFPKIVLMGFLFFCLLLFGNLALTQIANPKEDQWKSAGGKIVFSGEHKFEKSTNIQPKKMGEITVRGPGFIGLLVRKIANIGPGVGLLKLNGAGQSVQSLGSLAKMEGHYGWVWEGQDSFTDFVPSSNAGGWVPGPTEENPTTTLEVWVSIEGGVAARDDIAIEYEYWFFPLQGSRIVKVIKYGPNGEEIDVTPGNPITVEDPDQPDSDNVRIAPNSDSHVYAYSYRNWNKANWGKYSSLGAGWHPTGGEKRTYVKFDLSGIDAQKVGKATLKLFHYHTGGNSSLSLGVHAVTSPWQEGGGTYHSGQTEKSAAPGEISWVNQPTFDLSPVASFNPGSGAGKYIDVDITPLVMAWLTGKPNYGLMIKPVGIMSGRAPESSYGFYSRERQDKSKRPVLVLSGSGSVEQPGEPGGGLGGDVIDHDTGGIRIMSATYGGNCGVAKGNVTAHIARQCNGKSQCRYVVNHKIIGDPAFGCAKTYSVQYRCNNNPRVFEKTLAAEAGWGDKAVLLECADSSGGDGRYRHGLANGTEGASELHKP